MKTQARTIPDFCRSIGIGVTTFYRHKKSMPRVVKIGHQSRILESGEIEWRQRIQSEADMNAIQTNETCGAM